MRKRIKTLVTVIAAAATVILPSGMCSLKTFAAEPATFHISYVPVDENDTEGWSVTTWLPESDPDFEDNQDVRELQFFFNEVKDGDLVVIHNSDSSAPRLDLGTTRLSNLVLDSGSDFTMIQAGIIDVFDVMPESSCSISASIVTAKLYDPALINFNNDVANIVITSSEDYIVGTIGCSGTVGSLTCNFSDGTSDTMYNFKKNTLSIDDGRVQTSDEDYSTEPSSAAPQPPAAPAAPQQPSSGTSSDEYDQVPKTGDTNTAAWLLCAGALCMALSCGLRGKKVSR